MTHPHVLYIKYSRTISSLYNEAQLSSRRVRWLLTDRLRMSLNCVVGGPCDLQKVM